MHTANSCYILGAGAIGSLWACYAYKAERPMPLILRDSDRLAAYRSRGGMGITLFSGDVQRLPLPATTPTQINNPIRRVLVCTKAQQTQAALSELGDKLAPDAHIVLLQNGLGVAELIAGTHPDATLFQASTTEGAYRTSPFELVHAGRGQTLLGAFQSAHNSELAALTRALSVAPLEVHPEYNIAATLWRKLAINCAINPLTAIYRCKNGELAQHPEAAPRLQTIIDEILQLSITLGRDSWVSGLREQVYQVAAATAQNQSSMLQDVTANRDTEIDFITGYLLSQAAAVGVSLPANRAAFDEVKGLSRPD